MQIVVRRTKSLNGVVRRRLRMLVRILGIGKAIIQMDIIRKEIGNFGENVKKSRKKGAKSVRKSHLLDTFLYFI